MSFANDLSNDIRNHLRIFCVEKQISFYNPYTHEGDATSSYNTLEGDWMLLVVFGRDDAKRSKACYGEMKQKFPFITALLYTVQHKFNDTIYDLDVHCYHGKPYIVEKLGDVRYKIGPKSFLRPTVRVPKYCLIMLQNTPILKVMKCI